MGDRTAYLLRYQHQIDAFRSRYGEAIRRNQEKYAEWIRSLPFFEWTPVICRPEHEEFITGLICILYIDKIVNISFDNTATRIENEPNSEEEYKAWMKATGWHGPGIDKPDNK